MLGVENHQQIDRILDKNLQTLRGRLKQFLYSVLKQPTANHIHNPLELIQRILSYFLDTISQQSLQGIAATILQNQKEQKIQKQKSIASHKLGEQKEKAKPSDIEVDNQLAGSPMRIRDTNLLGQNHGEEIIINKEREQQEEEKIEREQINSTIFFMQIRNKLLEQNIGEQNHYKYFQLLILRKQQRGKYEEKYSILNYQQKKIIDSLPNEFDEQQIPNLTSDLKELSVKQQPIVKTQEKEFKDESNMKSVPKKKKNQSQIYQFMKKNSQGQLPVSQTQEKEVIINLAQQIKEGNNAKLAEKDPIAQWKIEKLQEYKEKQFLVTEELRSMLLNQFCSEKVIYLRPYFLKVGKGFRIMESVLNEVRCAFNKLKPQPPSQGSFINSEQNRDQKQGQQLSWSQQQKYYSQYNFLSILYNWKLPFTNQGRKQFFNRLRYKSILNKQKLLQQFEDWWLQLQKLSWNFKERCFEHKLKIQYLRLNEAQKYKKYLCNQCIQNQKQGPHCQIVCVSHFKPIKYKLQEQQHKTNQSQRIQEGQEQQQIFLCEECHLLGNNKYALVCGLHFQNIVQLCIQQQCVEADKFTLCSKCQQFNEKHDLHRKITFDRGQLMEQFDFKDKVEIDYSKELLKAKEALQIQPLEKIRKCYAQNILPIMSFLESFTISNNGELKKWVGLLVNQGKKEALTVLTQMMALNQENFTDSEKRSYLEAFNYVLQGELSAMFEGVWQRILHSCERINKLKNTNKSEVIAELNKKYEQISEIETDERVIAFPMRLSDVNPIHRSRIRRITIVKESEAQRDDKIRKEFRDKRGKFFKQQIRRKLIEAQVGAQQQRQIIQLFSKAKESQLWSLSDELKEQNTLYKYRTTIQSLSQTYEQIQKQFTAKLGECLPWSLMVSNKFSSLRVLRIQYPPKQYFNYLGREEYHYSIDAFALFDFINGNAQLEQAALKGVKISKMQQFVETLNPNNPDPYSMREKNEWLKARRPWKNLRLTLHSAYQLHPQFGYFNASTFAFRLSSLSYFQRQFQSLSGMAVVIKINSINDWGNNLERLLDCLRGIKGIKIQIHKIHSELLEQLLKGLTSFTEISSITFDRIKFSSKAYTNNFSRIQQIIRFLSRNNRLTNIRINNCFNFPALPFINTLKSLSFLNVQFGNGCQPSEFINANPLRSLTLQRVSKHRIYLQQELLNQLQHLKIDICQSIFFGPISSPTPSKIKHLCINDCKRIIDANSLKPIFSKLANLNQLSLSKFDFGYQLLSSIPSNNLEELHIWENVIISDVDFQLVDCKWPYLREITLVRCPQISERILRLCRFKGLMQISLDSGVLSLQAIKYLKGRGISCNLAYIINLSKRYNAGKINHPLFMTQQSKYQNISSFFSQISMKSKHNDIKSKLSKGKISQIQKSSFIQSNNKRLKQFNQKIIISKLESQQKLSKQCQRHKREYFYQCIDHPHEKKISLCNQCIQPKEQIFQHENHVIICKKHNDRIKYKLLTTQIEKDKSIQIFICQQCIQNQFIFIVSSCHYQVVQYMCIQPSCIEKDEFIICKTCLKVNDAHKNHRKIKLDIELLMKQRQNSLQKYQQISEIQGNSKRISLQQLRILLKQKFLPTVNLLDSLIAYRNEDTQNWVRYLIAEQRKKELMVLKQIVFSCNIQKEGSKEFNNQETFNRMIERELSQIFMDIWDKILYFCKLLNQFKDINEIELAALFDKRYEHIIEIKADNKTAISPMRLNDINPTYYSQVQKITIVKEAEYQRDQVIMQEWRKKRGIFFTKQIGDKLYEEKLIQEYICDTIMKLFIEAKQDQRGEITIRLNKLNNFKQYEAIIQSLQEQYEETNKNFYEKLRECSPWMKIKQNQFRNLKVIHLQYLKYEYDFSHQHYSIDAFELFKFIHQNPQLQSVTLKGLNIQKLQQFMEFLNPINVHPRLNKKRDGIPWLNHYEARKKLKLSLQNQLSLHSCSSYSSNPTSRVEDLSYFSDFFHWLSDITAVIRFNTDELANSLEKLIFCLRKIKNIKLLIDSNYQFTKKILSGLSLFTEITSLTLQDLRLSSKTNNQIFEIQSNLIKIFQNNPIKFLSLQRCNGFYLPQISTIELITFNGLKFRNEFDIDKFIHANKQLRSLKIRQMEFSFIIKEDLLNKLQYLSINNIKNLSFEIISPITSKIKYLAIQRINLTSASLEPIFSKLAYLNQLIISNIDFRFEILSFIPSKQLQKLYIGSNNLITDNDLKLIDAKWPSLRYISLYNCPSITEKHLVLCQFNGLMKICIKEKQILTIQGKKYLRGRGIQLDY